MDIKNKQNINTPTSIHIRTKEFCLFSILQGLLHLNYTENGSSVLHILYWSTNVLHNLHKMTTTLSQATLIFTVWAIITIHYHFNKDCITCLFSVFPLTVINVPPSVLRTGKVITLFSTCSIFPWMQVKYKLFIIKNMFTSVSTICYSDILIISLITLIICYM